MFASEAAPPVQKAMDLDSRALSEHERSAVRDFLIQVTLPIIIEKGGSFGVVGTGTLFKIADRHFLISAAHILDDHSPEQWSFGTTPSRGIIMTFGRGEFYKPTDTAVDVCIVELKDKDAVAELEKGWRFLTLDNVWIPDLSADDILLCGFPSAKSTFDGESLHGRLILVRSKLFDRPPDIKDSEPVKKGVDFFIQFDNPVNELTGENVSQLDIGGVSGSSIWAYKRGGWERRAIWSSELSLRVIGVQSAYLKNEYLRGKSWGTVLSLLNGLDTPIKGEARARMNSMLVALGYPITGDSKASGA
jgi:hypothetical protein